MRKIKLFIAALVAALTLSGFSGMGMDYASAVQCPDDASSRDRDLGDSALGSGAATEVPPVGRTAPEGAGEMGSRPSKYPPYHKPER
jgi:hypothetical protein